MQYLSIGDMDVGYEARGEGPPLVLLHGFLSDHRDWAPQTESLSAGFRVVVPELPGCGASPDPPESWRMPEYADWLAAFLGALGLRSAHIGGLSWGGILAQEMYRRHPERVLSLILADTYAGWVPSLGQQESDARLEVCLRLSELEPAQLVETLLPGMLSQWAPPERFAEVTAILADFHPSGFRTMTRACAEADTTGVWPTIAVPTLLIWGESDARSPLTVAQAFHEGIPGSRLVLIPGGHISNMESPAEFNAAVTNFLHSIDATAEAATS